MSSYACRFALALALLTGCKTTPDFRAFCEKAAPCEGEELDECMRRNREMWDQQWERSCGKEGAALISCETRYGKCETKKPFTLFMPTENCRGELDKLSACMRR